MKKLGKTSLTIMKFIFFTVLLIVPDGLYCQGVGISNTSITADPSSVLELRSNTQGVLIPRMTTAERDAISTPATGLLIFNTTTSTYDYYIGSWEFIGKTVVTNANLTGEITSVGNAAILGSFTSASLLTALTDETGTGTSVFSVAPTFTGVPLAPTAAVNTSTTQLATTAFVQANQSRYNSVNASSVQNTTSTGAVLVPDMTITPAEGTYVVNFNSQFSAPAVTFESELNTATVKPDVELIYNDIVAIDAGSEITGHALAFGGVSGETITEGHYDVTGAVTISGTLTLSGDANAVFVIRASTTLDAAASTIIVLTGGVTASNVYWVAEGAIGLGATCDFAGTILSHTAAIAVGTGTDLDGRMLTVAGALSFGTGHLSIPTDPPVALTVDLRSLASFAMFTGAGGIANSGASTYTGDIGSNLGAITTFGAAAAVNGTIFEAGITPVFTPIYHQATFGIYKGVSATPIANSERQSDRAVTSSVINLQAIVAVDGTEAITVKWNIDAQVSDAPIKIGVSNRILTLINVRP